MMLGSFTAVGIMAVTAIAVYRRVAASARLDGGNRLATDAIDEERMILRMADYVRPQDLIALAEMRKRAA